MTTKTDILRALKKETGLTGLRFPENMDFLSEDGILRITMTKEGLKANMQTDVAAFEGWAVAIKTICPDLAKQVVIEWESPDNNIKKSAIPHYHRFLYRVVKFCENYDWVSIKTIDNTAKESYERIKNEISHWVLNYPNNEAKKDVEGAEAKLEISLHDYLKDSGIKSNHQLPVGLFFEEKKENNQRTPAKKCQIDLWSIDNNTFTVYELKKDDNMKVGIISELMFYVNVIKDINEGIIKYPENIPQKNKKFRSLDVILENLPQNKMIKVEGAFLANNLHKILTFNKTELFKLLNDNKRDIIYKHKKFKTIII